MHRLLHTFKTEKIVFIDQITGDRPADNAAHNQTEGCRSNSHSRRPLRAHLFEQRTEGTSRTMPADHRDRTRRHTDQRPQIKNRGQSDTNKVLQNDKHGADSYQLQNAESAFFQHTQAGRITNAGKKHRHKKSLQRCIQRQMPKASGRHDKIQQRKQNAADNRSRDTVLVKNIEPAF